MVATESSLKTNSSEKSEGSTRPVTNHSLLASCLSTRCDSSCSVSPAALGMDQSTWLSSASTSRAGGRKLPKKLFTGSLYLYFESSSCALSLALLHCGLLCDLFCERIDGR